MKLPDFLEFEPFNELRQKMQAEHLGKFELFDSRIHITGWERELLSTKGINLSAAEVRILPDNTLAYKNSRIALISQVDDGDLHIASCEQVRSLRETRNQVCTAATDLSEIKQASEQKVCGACLQVLSYKGFDNSRNRRQVYSEEIQSSFSLEEYFKKYPAYPLESKPNNFHF